MEVDAAKAANPPMPIAGVRASPTDPPTAMFPPLGALTVDASSPSFTIVAVAAGSEGTVGGDEIEAISPTVIPEPAQWLMLTAGSALLTALGRRRSRRAKPRV